VTQFVRPTINRSDFFDFEAGKYVSIRRYLMAWRARYLVMHPERPTHLSQRGTGIFRKTKRAARNPIRLCPFYYRFRKHSDGKKRRKTRQTRPVRRISAIKTCSTHVLAQIFGRFSNGRRKRAASIVPRRRNQQSVKTRLGLS
jgi:hypothetical protein